ncbi:MAG: pyruvate formate lyase family protein, partial [Syntrophobacteraceae bacterium]
MKRCLNLFEQIVFFIASKAATLSHTVPSYSLMLEKGLLGICREVEEKMGKLAEPGANGENREKTAFYQAVRIALEGLMDYANRLAEHAHALAMLQEDESARRELLDMAAVCSRVPAHPAMTFREAVNAVWISQIGIHAENINMAISPGRLDQVLYPYYRKDVDEGRLELAEALELVGCLWFKLSDNVVMVPESSEEMFGGSGTSPAVTLGGVDRLGEDSVNDLTYIMLKATELLCIRDPNVNARYYYGKNPPKYLDRVSEVIIDTKAVPAIYNDVANIAALEGQRLETGDARDYAIIGCVEPASSGRDYAASSSILLNLVSAMEMALFSGKRPITGDDQIGPATPDLASTKLNSFEEFWNIFTTQLDWLIGQAIQMNECLGKVHQDEMPSPLL